MKTFKRLRSIFMFQRQYGSVDTLVFFNNSSSIVKNPYRAKEKKPLKTFKIGISNVLFNNNLSKGLFNIHWKYSFRPLFLHANHFSNLLINNGSQMQNCLKNLKKHPTQTLLRHNKIIMSRQSSIIKEILNGKQD